MSDIDDLATRVLAAVGDRADARVHVTATHHGLTRFANSHIHQHVGERSLTTSLQVVSGGRVAAATTTGTSTDALQTLADDTLAMAAVAPVDTAHPGLTPPTPASARDRSHVSTTQATPDDRVALVEAFVASGRGLNAAGYCETVTTDVVHANSYGLRRRATTSRATFDGIHRTDTSSGSAHATARGLGDIDAASLGMHAATRARRGEDPGDLDPGVHQVVLGPEAVATIAVFLSMYAFNARAVLEERSSIALGADQFDPAFRLADDATDPRSTDQPFDLEGVDRNRLVLVEHGRVANLTHDRRTAAAAGAVSTGHHIANSDTVGPVATSLVVAPGRETPTQLVAGVERGVYVTAFNYCRVQDTTTLVVTGLTRNGTFFIEDGRISRPLGNLRFTQSFTTALGPGQVLGVGNDDRHADGEFGPGMTIAPSLRLATWTFTGNQHG